MKLILDASVVLAAHDAGSEGEKGREFRASAIGHEKTAPAIIVWEVANRFVRPTPPDAIAGAAQTRELVSDLLRDITIASMDEDAIERAVAIARKHNLSFYDASYVEVLLRDESATLVTNDERMRMAGELEAGKTRSLGITVATTRLRATAP